MSSPLLTTLRRDVAANLTAAIAAAYPEELAEIQSVVDGDGKTLKTIYWGVLTPRFTPHHSGYLPQWTHQDIIVELRASVDYQDRTLDARYLTLIGVLEDVCARADLAALMEGATVKIPSPPVIEDGEEGIDNGRYVTTYRIRVFARGRVEGE